MEPWQRVWVILAFTTTATLTNALYVHPEECEEPEMSPHMEYTAGDYRHFLNSVIYLSCFPGFTLTGPQTSVCVSDGKIWDPPLNSSFCEELEETGNHSIPVEGEVEVFHGVTDEAAYHPSYLDDEKHDTKFTEEINPEAQDVEKEEDGEETDYGEFKTEHDFVNGKHETLNDDVLLEHESESDIESESQEMEDEIKSVGEEDTEVVREEREDNEEAVEDHQRQEEEEEEDPGEILEEEQSLEANNRKIHPEGMPAKCHGPKPNSPCRASIPSYWFNYRTGECEFFIYGGCQGINVFPDETTCRETCQTFP